MNTGFDMALDFNDTSRQAFISLDKVTGLTDIRGFCSLVNTRNHNKTSRSRPISVDIVKQQGQSGSYLPKTLVNLNLAFKCFEHIIILLAPLLWFIREKSRHIFHPNTRFSRTKRRSAAAPSLSAEKMKSLNLCCCSSIPVCVVVLGNGGWKPEQVHARGAHLGIKCLF